LGHHSTGNCVRRRVMNPHVCSHGAVRRRETWQERDAPQGRGYKMTSRAYRRSQLWAATANFTSIVLDAALLYGIRLLLLLCNCRHAHAQQFYWAKFLFGDRQVFVFNFSFEITAAGLNLCDGPGLDLEIDSF